MDVRVVILGKTQSGKSNLANTVFEEEVFKIDHSSNSATEESQAETKSIHGRSITLVDTPGFFNTRLSEEAMRPKIVSCIIKCDPGPHAFLIVLKVEDFTEHEKAVIDKIQEYFSEEMYRYATVVFTHGDLLQEGQTIEDFYQQNKHMRDLVKKCGGRCHVIDNRYWKKENPSDEYRSNQYQVAELLKTIDKMSEENKGSVYTKEMQEKVEGRQAKARATSRLSIKLACIATGVLLGAFFGIKLSVNMVLKSLERPTVVQVSALAGGAIGGGLTTAAVYAVGGSVFDDKRKNNN